MKTRIQKQGLSMGSEVENLCSMYEALNWISSPGKKNRSDDVVIYFVAERSCMKPTMNYRKRGPSLKTLSQDLTIAVSFS